MCGSNIMDINEKIELSAYNSNWLKQFADEKRVLLIHFANAHIEHVGSTSIDGMVAKPIIDMLIGIKSYPATEEMIKTLEGLGYNGFGRDGDLPGRLYLARRGIINYNAHITEYLGDFWNYIVSFREYLKAHKDDALEYAKLKQNIVNKGIDTMLEYSKEKGEFMSGLLKKMNNTKDKMA
jgi:GrpB-like predicted nucleotidyltransferase (UPF0157 family)